MWSERSAKGLYRHLVSYLAKGRQSGNWGRRAAVVDKKWGNRKLDTPAPGRGLESTSMPAGDPQRTWFPEMVTSPDSAETRPAPLLLFRLQLLRRQLLRRQRHVDRRRHRRYMQDRRHRRLIQYFRRHVRRPHREAARRNRDVIPPP